MLELFAKGAVTLPSASAEPASPSQRTSSSRRDQPPQLAALAARVLPGPAVPAVAGLAAGTALAALALRASSH